MVVEVIIFLFNFVEVLCVEEFVFGMAIVLVRYFMVFCF